LQECAKELEDVEKDHSVILNRNVSTGNEKKNETDEVSHKI